MKGTFLDKVIEESRKRVAVRSRETDMRKVRGEAEVIRGKAAPHAFYAAIARAGRINIIAEFKRASPSKGVINDRIGVRETVQAYERGGAAAISVLTEPEHFKGSLDDLAIARASVSLPLLRKDFLVDEYQIYEGAICGADAVLLIVAALSEAELSIMLATADGLGMDAIVEVHTAEELTMANNVGAKIVGVNNRDLQTLAVSLDVARNLIKERPGNALMIAESGLSSRSEIDELRSLGYDGFLIGETLMRSGDPAAALEELA